MTFESECDFQSLPGHCLPPCVTWAGVTSSLCLSLPLWAVRVPGDNHPAPCTLRDQAPGCLALPGSAFPWADHPLRSLGHKESDSLGDALWPLPLSPWGRDRWARCCRSGCPTHPPSLSCPPCTRPQRLFFKMQIGSAHVTRSPEICRWLPTALPQCTLPPGSLGLATLVPGRGVSPLLHQARLLLPPHPSPECDPVLGLSFTGPSSGAFLRKPLLIPLDWSRSSPHPSPQALKASVLVGCLLMSL